MKMQTSQHGKKKRPTSRERTKIEYGAPHFYDIKTHISLKKAKYAVKHSAAKQAFLDGHAFHHLLRMKIAYLGLKRPNAVKHSTGERWTPFSVLTLQTLHFSHFFHVFATKTPSAKYRKNEGGETTRVTPFKTQKSYKETLPLTWWAGWVGGWVGGGLGAWFALAPVEVQTEFRR